MTNLNRDQIKDKRRLNYIGLAVFAISLIYSFWVFASNSEDSDKLSKADVNLVIEKIEDLKSVGMITYIDPSLNRAEIDLDVWNLATLSEKESVGKIIAYYCGFKKGTDIYWLDLYDRSSERKIAKYGYAGLEVY